MIDSGNCVSHLHDLILELGQEVVDNLVLLDGQRVKVDLLHAVDLAGLDQSTELGDGLPLLLLVLAATTTTATSTSSAAITASGSETTAARSSTISHCEGFLLFCAGGGGRQDVVCARARCCCWCWRYWNFLARVRWGG